MTDNSTYLPRTAIRAISCVLLLGVFQSACSDQEKQSRFLEKADNYFDAGEFEKARIEYKNLLRADPQNIRANFRLGSIWMDRGSPVRALPHLARAEALSANDPEITMKLALALQTVGDLRSARAKAQEVLDQAPAHPDALMLVAQTVRSDEDIAALKTRLAALAGAKPLPPAWHLASATLAIRDADYAAAENHVKAARDLAPDSFQPHLAMATIHYGRGEMDQVESALLLAARHSSPMPSPRLKLAKFYLRIDKRDKAKVVLQALQTEAPEFLPPFIELARIAVAEADYDESVRLLQAVFRTDPANLDARLVQGQTLIAKGDYEHAVKILTPLNDEIPNVPICKYHLAQAYIGIGEFARAESQLKTAIDLDPGHPETILLLSEVKLRAGDAKAVVESMSSLLKEIPGLVKARMLLAAAYRQQGKFDQAVALYRELATAQPDNPEPRILLGLTMRQQGMQAEARSAFLEAERLAPDHPVVVAQLSDLDALRNDFPAAHRRVDALLAESPDSPALHYVKATLHVTRKEWTLAEASLKKCLAINPRHPAAANLLVSVYLADGKLDTALQEIESILANNPENQPALALAAEIYREQRNFPEARRYYEKLLAADPGSVPTLNNLAYLYSEHFNDLDRAHELASKARNSQPRNPGIADTLGWVYFKQGQFGKAMALLEESAAALPESPDVQFHLGMARSMMGLRVPAIEAFKKAISRDFDGKEEALRRLALLGDGEEAPTHSAEDLQSLLDQFPDDLIARMQLATLSRRQGEHARAATLCEEAIKRNPEFLPAIVMLADLHAGPLADHEQAMVLARKARDLAPDDPATAARLGSIAYRAGNARWAHSLLQESNQREPGNTQTMHDLAWASYRLGFTAEALATMNALVDLSPAPPLAEEAETFIAMLSCSLDPSRLDSAEARITETLQNKPAHLPARMANAAILELRGRAPDAIVALRKILADHPDFPLAQSALARLLSRSTDEESLKTAQKLASKARQSLPDDPRTILTFAEIKYREGKHDYAIGLLEELERDNSLDAEGLGLLGLCRFRNDQPAEGRATLQRALQAGLREPLRSEAKALLDE